MTGIRRSTDLEAHVQRLRGQGLSRNDIQERLVGAGLSSDEAEDVLEGHPVSHAIEVIGSILSSGSTKPGEPWSEEDVAEVHTHPPRRLSDPLRSACGYLIFTGLLLSTFFVQRALTGDRASLEVELVLLGLAVIWFLSFYLATTPRRRPNAFLLRSFRSDRGTRTLKQTLEIALGSEFRLEGIRKPLRHFPVFLRLLFLPFMLLSYARSPHMGLAAGKDWLARLWRSLGDARLAVMDLRDITHGVALEASLALRVLGFRRLLFVGDTSRSHEEWTQLVQAYTGAANADQHEIHVVRWRGDSEEDQRTFAEEVRSFATATPEGPAGLAWEALPVIDGHVSPADYRDYRAREQFQLWISTAIGATIYILWSGGFLWELFPTAGAALSILAVASSALAWHLATLYVWRLRCLLAHAKRLNSDYVVPVRRQYRWMRVVADLPVVVGLLVALAVVAPNLLMITGLTQSSDAHANSQLDQIGQAVEGYLARHGSLPISLDQLTEEDPRTGEPIMVLVPDDPWGYPYELKRLSNKKYQIVSVGEDGQEGTEDDLVWPKAEE